MKTGDEDGLELLVYVNNIRMGGIESVLVDGWDLVVSSLAQSFMEA